MAKIDPYKYIEQDKKTWLSTPGVAGVYHKDGRQYASDRHVLIRISQDYPRKYEGKLIGTDGEVVKKFGYDGQKMDEDAKPLNYKGVIPSDRTINDEYREYRVDIDSLEDIAKTASGKSRKTELFDKYVSFVDYNTGKEIGKFNPKYLRKAVDFMRWLGLHRILLHKELLSRPLLVYDGMNMLMLMPVVDYSKSAIKYSLTPSEERKQERKNTQKTQKNTQKTQTKTRKPTTMTRKRTTAKAHGSATTMRDASRILKAQKDDYQKIFRAEVKKSKDPKSGAKKAGKIYRDRYGATATARWKKALKRAK